MSKITAIAENWEPIWQATLDASSGNLGRQFSPVIIQSPIVLVQCSTSVDYWKKQSIGYVNQQIETGLIGGGLARVNAKRLLVCDELSLIQFPFTVDYRLSIDLFAKVAASFALTVYEYTGVVS